MFKNIPSKKSYDFGSLHGYKVVGVVSFYIETRSRDDLKKIIDTCKKKRLRFNPVGGGSNTLIKDRFSGVFVHWKNSRIKIMKDDGNKVLIRVGSACTKADFNDFCAERGLSGIEFWAGIPGMVGGGIAMNAGAYNEEIKNSVSEVHYIDDKGGHRAKSHDLKWSYRKLELPKYAVITDVIFELTRTDPKAVKKLSASYILDREKKHPLEYPSCGSVFKNPENSDNGAWWYVREAGLGGFKIGGAKVSKKHTNFIINADNATSEDIIRLIKEIKKRVKAKFKVKLEEEIKIY
jgi:UDP-N-acetylmuramate dehydrogenase